MGRWTLNFFFVVCLVALTYVYLYPGSEALLDKRTDIVMSDGTDIASLPYLHELLTQIWREHPSRLFYGSVYADTADPEHGIASWIPWNERFIVLFHSIFFPPEQLSTAFSATILILNGVAMYLLAIFLGWSPWIAAALSLSWAFNPFTRARAKVHPALAGIYHVPLLFLGLLLIARGKSYRSIALAALAFLLAGTVAHYYLITTLFLSPFFLWFLYLQPEFKRLKMKIFKRLTLAVSPLLFFLAFNFYFAVPSQARIGAVQSMNFKDFRDGQNDPFLDVFYAHPIDFLAGDIALETRTMDWNPLRAWIGDSILHDPQLTNSHERTNGIRWSILALATAGVSLLFRRQGPNRDPSLRPNIIFFSAFALFAFWQASGPNFPSHEFNPSFWLYSLCSKIRVSNRAGLFVHFSLLMLAGLFLSTNFKLRKYLVLPGVLVSIVLMDYLPLVGMPMAPIQPAYTALQRTQGPCGLGMAFPFFNSYIAMGAQYVFTQRMRGSDCTSLNQISDVSKLDLLTRAFPPAQDFTARLSENSKTAEKLEFLAKCLPLNWIAFHEIVPRDWAVEMCRRLGWTMFPDGVCLAPDKNQPRLRSPEQCL